MRLITFLYITNFFTGAIIMVVELLGTRLMAPCFGTGLYVWTALITVTLVSLAIGYRTGGWLADRFPRADLLYGLIFGAGVLLLLILLLRRPVLLWGVRFNLAWGALATATILFGPPLFLLGTVAPYSVKLCAAEFGRLGSVVGRLYAISTLGSFVGTVGAGFLFLPNFSNVTTLVMCAAALAVLAALYFGFFRTRVLPVCGAAIVLGIAIFIAWRSAGALPRGTLTTLVEWRTLEQRNGFYGTISVVDLGTPVNEQWHRRFLLNDGLTQGSYEPARRIPAAVFPYALCDLVLAHAPRLERVLVLGLGAGFVPAMLKPLIARPDDDPARTRANFVVVEINPAMVDIAARWFDFPPEEFTIVIEDARTWVSTYRVGPDAPPFDAIIVDTFLGDNTPGHLLTHEMFAELKRILAPGGALAMNVFGSIRGPRSRLLAALVRTLGEPRGGPPLFPHVQVFSQEATAIAHNVYLLASGDPGARRPDGILRIVVPHLDAHDPADDFHKEAMRSLRDQTSLLAGVPDAPVLTDDYAVADHLDIAVKEEIRRNIVKSWGEMLLE
ncbi:MAG TPA: hypothetical protein DCM87_18165 [Planctomycetes bacterium]|nr:hypothetical protein [Planctomycetota bacterium]